MNDRSAHLLRMLGRLLRPHSLAQMVLFAYACGLVIAAVQLNQWRVEVTHSLLQLSADRQFLARVSHRGETIDPEWHRRKALSLLGMTEKLDHKPLWSVVFPGSWDQVDDLQQRLAAHIEQEFAEVVVETMIRELYRRTSQLTGMPQHPATGELITSSDCQLPSGALDRHRVLSAAAEDLPEFAALQTYVAQVERVDTAALSLLALNAGSGSAEQLQGLAEYTLGARLPTRLAESPRLFRQREEVSVRPTIMLERLQWATRCTLYKGQSALFMRLFATNELFALERALNEQQAGLFSPAALAMPFDQIVTRYHSVLTLLQEQQALLERGQNAWMTQGISRLGPGYEKLLTRMANTQLLGPGAIEQVSTHSSIAFAGFRAQFEATFGRDQPGVIWLDDGSRFGLSPQREGLRKGLASLLQFPFMTTDLSAGAPPGQASTGLTQPVALAKSLSDARRRFLAETLPLFPSDAGTVTARLVDRRVAQLIFENTQEALRASLPRDRQTPLDLAAFRRQRAEMAVIRKHLDQIDGGVLGRRLEVVLDNEVVQRLRLLQDQWRALPIYSSQVRDFSTWAGDRPPIWPSLGANDRDALQLLLAQQSEKMEAITLRAADLLELGGPSIAQQSTGRLWRRLIAERRRYRAQDVRSSLLGFERYLMALGEMRLANCAEQLGQFTLPPNDDDVALRWMELHGALTSRCFQLRSRPPDPGAPGLASATGATRSEPSDSASARATQTSNGGFQAAAIRP